MCLHGWYITLMRAAFGHARTKTRMLLVGGIARDLILILLRLRQAKNITALECIVADGWQMGSYLKTPECWFDYGESLSPSAMVGTPPNDWVFDILANQRFARFIKATATHKRTNRGEKAYTNLRLPRHAPYPLIVTKMQRPQYFYP